MGVNFITGGILILCGLLVKRFPNLIAGYNTMPKEEKAKVDIDGLSSMMRNMLIGLGIFVILWQWISMSLTLDVWADWLQIGIIAAVVIFMLIKAQSYHKEMTNNESTKSSFNPKKRKRIY